MKQFTSYSLLGFTISHRQTKENHNKFKIPSLNLNSPDHQSSQVSLMCERARAEFLSLLIQKNVSSKQHSLILGRSRNNWSIIRFLLCLVLQFCLAGSRNWKKKKTIRVFSFGCTPDCAPVLSALSASSSSLQGAGLCNGPALTSEHATSFPSPSVPRIYHTQLWPSSQTVLTNFLLPHRWISHIYFTKTSTIRRCYCRGMDTSLFDSPLTMSTENKCEKDWFTRQKEHASNARVHSGARKTELLVKVDDVMEDVDTQLAATTTKRVNTMTRRDTPGLSCSISGKNVASLNCHCQPDARAKLVRWDV